MKRLSTILLLGCGLACLAGCDEVKRRATEGIRGEAQNAADSIERKAREKAHDSADSAINKASGDDAAAADKRNKLKGKDDDDK
ncbi:MAG TPA: hypothetical protein VKB78_17585 [Pirellulales bacterium]|nr:hypothetical protein [Pirellulales bacterium]